MQECYTRQRSILHNAQHIGLMIKASTRSLAANAYEYYYYDYVYQCYDYYYINDVILIAVLIIIIVVHMVQSGEVPMGGERVCSFARLDIF